MKVMKIIGIVLFVHFKQVTCGETLDLVREARKKGIDVTCDVDLYHVMTAGKRSH